MEIIVNILGILNLTIIAYYAWDMFMDLVGGEVTLHQYGWKIAILVCNVLFFFSLVE